MAPQRILWVLISVIAIFDIVLLSLCLYKTISPTPEIHLEKYNDGLYFESKYTAPVGLRVGSTQHYRINAPDSDIEWSRLIPSGGHLVHVRNEKGEIKKYTVTLFHQFKCLDVIRRQYNGPPTTPLSPLTIHCMNYLRQSVLCHLNIGLESAKNVMGTVASTYDLVCNDWTQLYEEVERNQNAFRQQHPST